MENPRYCRFHIYVSHPTSDCKILKRIFKEKVESGELNLGTEGVHKNPLPVRTFTISEPPVKETVQSLIEHVYELLYLSKAQRKDMFVALNHIVSGRRPLIQETTTGPSSTDTEMYDWGLLTTVHIKGNEFKRAFIDVGTAVNIIPLKTLRAAGITRREATHAPIAIRDHEGISRNAYSFITLKVTERSICTEAKFFIIREDPGYDMVLGRTWIHAERTTVPSTHPIIDKDSESEDEAEDAPPFEHLEEVKTLMGLTQELGDNPYTFVRRFRAQASLIPPLAPILPMFKHVIMVQGLLPMNNLAVIKSYEWVTSSQQYYTQWLGSELLQIGHSIERFIAEDLAKHDQHYIGYSLPRECPYGPQLRNSIKQVIPNQRKIFKARSTKPNKFHKGDLVLKAVQRGLHSTRNSNWEGPFMVAESVAGGYYKLTNTDGGTLPVIHENWLKAFI